MYVIYSKPDCGYCKKIEMVLELLGKDYDIKVLDVDFTAEEFEERFNSIQFPQVELDGKSLGDCNQTIAYLKEHRILT
tara:strand:- start:3406 stop:3639 length:234 start_codon:yes stop_codon:yes gene_type:complete